MKCPHCGNQHPDNYKFCPETGKTIEPQFLICDNPYCSYRQPLPLVAKFCPNCGKRVGQNSVNADSGELFLIGPSLQHGLCLVDEQGRIVESDLLMADVDKHDMDFDLHYSECNHSNEYDYHNKSVVDYNRRSQVLILVTRESDHQLYVVSKHGLIHVADYHNGRVHNKIDYTKSCVSSGNYFQVDDTDKSIRTFYKFENNVVSKVLETPLKADFSFKDLHYFLSNVLDKSAPLYYDKTKYIQDDYWPREIETGDQINIKGYACAEYAFSSRTHGDLFIVSRDIPEDIPEENYWSAIHFILVDSDGNIVCHLGNNCPVIKTILHNCFQYFDERKADYAISTKAEIFPTINCTTRKYGLMNIKGEVLVQPQYSGIKLIDSENYALEDRYCTDIYFNVEDGQLYGGIFKDYLVGLPNNYIMEVRHRKTNKIVSTRCLDFAYSPTLNLYVLAESKDGYWEDHRTILDSECNIISQTDRFPSLNSLRSRPTEYECWDDIIKIGNRYIGRIESIEGLKWAAFNDNFSNLKLFSELISDGSCPQFDTITVIKEKEGENNPQMQYVDLGKELTFDIPWKIPQSKKELLRIESFSEGVILVSMKNSFDQYLIDYNGKIICSAQRWRYIRKVSPKHYIADSTKNRHTYLLDMKGNQLFDLTKVTKSKDNINNISIVNVAN